MHISEGVLSAPVLAAGAVFAAGGLYIGLKGLTDRKIVFCGVMAAVFFVGSLIHVPIGFTNAHLLLCGLLGVLLGWAAFPAIFAALVLQALLFQYGGITTLGVNTATMGAAAVSSWYIFRTVRHMPGFLGNISIAGFCAGFFGVAVSSALTACALAFSSDSFLAAAAALFAAHMPVMIAEGIVTAFTAGFIGRLKPQLLAVS